MRITLTTSLASLLCMITTGLAACGADNATDATNKPIKPIAANAQADNTTHSAVTKDRVDTSNYAHASTSPNQSGTAAQARCDNRVIINQYQQQNPTRKTQALGCGQIIKVLPDDNKGSRHQRLLVRLDHYPQVTVLIAHNIDLAPRVAGAKANQPIRFYGEYIYNDKGGVVHWTHKDPAARHQDGWLDYQGKRYW